MNQKTRDVKKNRPTVISLWLRAVAWILIPVELMVCMPPNGMASVKETDFYFSSTVRVSHDLINENLGGINLYEYCRGDPVNKNDPLGLEDKCKEIEKELGEIGKALLKKRVGLRDLRRTETILKKYLNAKGISNKIKAFNNIRTDLIEEGFDEEYVGLLTSFARKRLEYHWEGCNNPPQPPSSPLVPVPLPNPKLTDVANDNGKISKTLKDEFPVLGKPYNEQNPWGRLFIGALLLGPAGWGIAAAGLAAFAR